MMPHERGVEERSRVPWRLYAAVGAGVAAWVGCYTHLGALAGWVTYGVLNLRRIPESLQPCIPCGRAAAALPPELRLSAAVEFFVYEVPKVLLLLALVVFVMGMVRSFFTPERTRAILLVGYLFNFFFTY